MQSTEASEVVGRDENFPALRFCPELGIMKPRDNRTLRAIFLGKAALL